MSRTNDDVYQAELGRLRTLLLVVLDHVLESGITFGVRCTVDAKSFVMFMVSSFSARRAAAAGRRCYYFVA
jgi:hypothetical protein